MMQTVQAWKKRSTMNSDSSGALHLGRMSAKYWVR